MRVPERLEPLLNFGVIEQVLRPLMSGKEAEVYLVVSDGEERVAKVYKNAQFRSFQNRADYTEGRRVRNSREQRAMNKRTRHGRAKTEDAWRSAEVDAIHRLRAANVRVPEPFAFTEGVLVMELVKDEHGGPAPRLVDRDFSREEATQVFHILLREVVKMLCAGIVHADLSDFNVLMSADGPVIIDFPQAIDPAGNRNARKLLIRDVKNLTGFLGRFAPELRGTSYGPEIWDLYERSELEPDTELTGKFQPKKAQESEVDSLLAEILHLEQEARERRERLGLPPPRARKPIVFETPAVPKPKPAAKATAKAVDAPSRPPKKRRRRKRRSTSAEQPQTNSRQVSRSAHPTPAPEKAAAKPRSPEDRPRRRRRRRRRSGPKPPSESRPAGG
jgi:RIO kinase 1